MTPPPASPPKRDLRRDLLARREAIPPEARAAASAQIVARLSAWLEARGTRRVGLYWPHRSEPDLLGLGAALAGRCALALPVVEPDDKSMRFHAWTPGAALAPNRYGIPEPVGAPEVEMVAADAVLLVPALALDRHGARLGYGGGFYDRFLAVSSAVPVGVVFDALLLPRLPREAHDRLVEYVASETGVRPVARSSSIRRQRHATDGS
jgi:5-formyltetrahydrofolate cyclo-ligase